MSRITFLGASGTVTGSSFFLSGNDGRGILVDLGMFQGSEDVTELNYRELGVSADKVLGVILTHAHLDHCGRLPLIIKAGFKGNIYMTEATQVLTELTLLDAAKIARENENHPVMYDELDVRRTLTHTQIVDYHQEFQIGQFKVRLLDAGHILGSASVEVTDTLGKSGAKRIVFSGDLGNSPEDIVRPTEQISQADIVLMESTYGDRVHSNEDPTKVLLEEIQAVERDKGVLLIPAFSIERAQEVLHEIDHLKKEGQVKNETPVYLDSPMAIKATEIYRRYKNLYNAKLAAHAAVDDPFNFPGLVMTEDSKESREIEKAPPPKVIIAGSGMMTGGRILHHGIDYLPLETTRLLIVGYQGANTTGRRIIDGQKTVSMYGTKVKVRAHIRKSSGMSAHADQPKLLKWISSIQGVRKVYLIHGEDESRRVLAKEITANTKVSSISLPTLGYSEEL